MIGRTIFITSEKNGMTNKIAQVPITETRFLIQAFVVNKPQYLYDKGSYDV